jgi:hypothetical protein
MRITQSNLKKIGERKTASVEDKGVDGIRGRRDDPQQVGRISEGSRMDP